MTSVKTKKLVLAAFFLALGYVLPFVTGQIPQIGQMLSPMHLPVLLCGFICGPFWGLAVGAICPILRSLTLGMPALFPTAIAMMFELAAYGFFAGLFYRILKKNIPNIYVSLILAMIIGRLVWGAVMLVITGISQTQFSFEAFLAAVVTGSLPGIIIQIVLIPLIVIALRKTGVMKE